LQQIINQSSYVIYQSISSPWMNCEYSCDKSAISFVNTYLCRPLSSDAGRRRMSKCRSNRTKFNINDSDAASTHDVVRYVVLAGLPQLELDRVQSVVNAAARLSADARKYDHVTPLLMDLHWLHTKRRCRLLATVVLPTGQVLASYSQTCVLPLCNTECRTHILQHQCRPFATSLVDYWRHLCCIKCSLLWNTCKCYTTLV